MKKILVVTESNSVWGAERSLLALSEHAARNGVNLHFLISEDSPLSANLDKLGLPYRRHRFAGHPALNSNGSLAAAGVATLLGEVRSVLSGAIRIWPKFRGFDSVLVFSIWQAPETILGSWMAHTPVDIDLHETFGNSRAMKLVGLISKASRRVIVPSAVLAAKSGLKRFPRLSIIPRPVKYSKDVTPSDHRPLSAPLAVGVFGQIQPHKRVLEVGQQVVATRARIRLLVVGGNPAVNKRSEYELRVRDLVDSMENDSQVVDFVPDVADYMATCDVVVNASSHEAFGRTIVEAVAMGCYPISVGDWGPKETIAALGVGTSVDDLSDLSSVLVDLDHRRRGALLVKEIPPTTAEYEISKIAEKYFSLLTSVRSK